MVFWLVLLLYLLSLFYLLSFSYVYYPILGRLCHTSIPVISYSFPPISSSHLFQYSHPVALLSWHLHLEYCHVYEWLQIFITARQLPVCWCGALPLTRGRVCRWQFLLVLASEVILKSQSLGTCLFFTPKTRRVTVEVFYTTSTREWLHSKLCPASNLSVLTE